MKKSHKQPDLFSPEETSVDVDYSGLERKRKPQKTMNTNRRVDYSGRCPECGVVNSDWETNEPGMSNQPEDVNGFFTRCTGCGALIIAHSIKRLIDVELEIAKDLSAD
jgi:hypothetical protein